MVAGPTPVSTTISRSAADQEATQLDRKPAGRVEELPDDRGLRALQLHAVESARHATGGDPGITADQLGDLGGRERDRNLAEQPVRHR